MSPTIRLMASCTGAMGPLRELLDPASRKPAFSAAAAKRSTSRGWATLDRPCSSPARTSSSSAPGDGAPPVAGCQAPAEHFARPASPRRGERLPPATPWLQYLRSRGKSEPRPLGSGCRPCDLPTIPDGRGSDWSTPAPGFARLAFQVHQEPYILEVRSPSVHRPLHGIPRCGILVDVPKRD